MPPVPSFLAASATLWGPGRSSGFNGFPDQRRLNGPPGPDRRNQVTGAWGKGGGRDRKRTGPEEVPPRRLRLQRISAARKRNAIPPKKTMSTDNHVIAGRPGIFPFKR